MNEKDRQLAKRAALRFLPSDLLAKLPECSACHGVGWIHILDKKGLSRTDCPVCFGTGKSPL